MEPNRYFMAQEREEQLDVVIYGTITSWPWRESDVSSYTLSKVLAASKAKRVVVHVNSSGGDVAEGLAIFNQLMEREEVVTVCDGFACSMASAIFMAGKRRIMRPASLLMIHNASMDAGGNAEELRKAADDLETINNVAVSTYRSRISLSDEELKTLLDHETFITPEQAMEWGFATEISQKVNGGGPTQSAGDLILARLTAETAQDQTAQALAQLNAGMAKLLERVPEHAADPVPPAAGPLAMFQAFQK